MSNKDKIVIFLMLCLAVVIGFSGCSSVDSIKIGGSYTGEDGTKIEGDVEVVLSKAESAYTGLSVLEQVENPNEKFVVLSKKQVEKIVEKIEPEKKSILSISPLKKLGEFIHSK